MKAYAVISVNPDWMNLDLVAWKSYATKEEAEAIAKKKTDGGNAIYEVITIALPTTVKGTKAA